MERGFTVNKQFSIENLREKSLIALCWVTDIRQHQRKLPKKFKSPEMCCITLKMPVGNTKIFASNGRRNKLKESH